MNEVEAVKAAIANTTDFDGDRMASRYADSELHAVALAAIAALDAARGEAEPVAWLYGAPRRAPFKGFEARASHSRWPDWMQNGWTETPLYAHPPRGDRVARVVEWLRDCALSSAIPDDPAQMIADLADAIERGEPFNG